MNKRKVIIDCDPGIDDILAIMVALSSKELEVKALTIVSGNVHVSKGFKNALQALKIMGRLDIPIYIGDGKPLKRELVVAEDTHGVDGIGENFFEDINEGIVKKGAVNYIIDILNKEKDVSIIALGPLTNLAEVLKKSPNTFNKIIEIVSMGGTFKSHGNCSPVAEFNYWVDPHSVKYIMKNSQVPFHMVGLDVTRECVLTPNHIELLNQLNDEKADFIVKITRFYVDFHWKQEKILGCVINDPLAVLYFINRSLCRGFSAYMDVVTEGIAIGQTVIDSENFYKFKANCNVLTTVDSNMFMKEFLTRILPHKKSEINLILNNKKYSC